jgi:hypothetical protein
MENLTIENLYTYPLSLKNGARKKNKEVDLARVSEEEMMKYSVWEGTARLADELIRRYGLDVSEDRGRGA